MKSKECIVVKTPKQLEKTSTYYKVQQRNLRINLPRRLVPLEIERAIKAFKGKIVWPDPKRSQYKLPESIIHEFDLENKWYWEFRKVKVNGSPLRKCLNFKRLQLIDIWHQLRDMEGLDKDEEI
ncbi:hypothetical protein QSV34_10615 [Porticoccus sp. W117]|uniref:hypothetical protein n=1 Tax=Porticoccus sp. W117 TaxID=3054777 RepID=UPI0025948C9D|nr:hypothetical protein [Porticoccus sp. W117]MDM3871803.1 hypothetical protein [Porticoccus sp. W117]